MIYHVEFSSLAKKQIRKIPAHIVGHLMAWVEAVENDGLEYVRKNPGFHDEPLRGKRQGQRSIRLSRSYRAIYKIVQDEIQFVLVEEVSKHGY